ncbi:MAG: DMT family transporter [Vicinamibacteria bacterium]
MQNDGDVARGWLNGFLGMAIFSGSLPATRIAVQQLDPLFVTFARAAFAALPAIALLLSTRAVRPTRAEWRSLAVVAAGVVAGFPLLTALALQRVTSAHALLFIALLPLCTASFAVLRAGERPPRAFWAFASLGAAIVAGYSLTRAHGERSPAGDALMVAAVLACGLGYAEGAVLSRRLGGAQVICWALALSLPLMLPAALWRWPAAAGAVTWPAWAALGYVSAFSMFVGFVFWYRGLAQGGIAAVGQLQLVQPFLGLALAAWLLGEPVGWGLLLVAAGAIACVAGARSFASAGRRR